VVMKKPGKKILTKKLLPIAIAAAVALALSGCGGGSGGGSTGSSGSSGSSGAAISGAGVNSPMVNATVEAFEINLQTGIAGSLPIATASTGAQAQIQGLLLPFPVSPPYLVKFSVNANTKLVDGSTPILSEMYTVILSADSPVYATAISSMAVVLANTTYKNYLGEPGNSAKGSLDLYKSYLSKATNTVKTTLGFSVLDSADAADIDIFTTPPFINNASATADEIKEAVLYRAASNAAVKAVKKLSGAGDTAAAIANLAADLEDGAIDGKGKGGDVTYEAVTGGTDSDKFASLTGLISQVAAEADDIADVVALFETEADMTGGDQIIIPAQPPQIIQPKFVADADNDGIPDDIDKDFDNDGFDDDVDALPLDKTEWLDNDNDGIGDNKDTDDDNDGVLDSADDFPFDSSRNSADDLDNDGWPAGQDADDQDPNVPGGNFVDSDGDGIGDATDLDIDGDGVNNTVDAFDYDKSEWSDTDSDGTDNGGITDGAGFGDNSDPDIDGDNALNEDDIAPFDPAVQTIADMDNDGIPDATDPDKDGDGLLNAVDGFEGQYDENPDRDSDGTKDGQDNCVDLANSEQVDANNNGIGLACEALPTAENMAIRTNADAEVNITLLGENGADGSVHGVPVSDSLTYQIVDQPAQGVLSGSGKDIAYSPNSDFSGSDSFTYTVSDGENDSSVATVNITVNALPVIGADPATTATVGVNYEADLQATDTDSQDLTYSLAGNKPGWMSISDQGFISGIPTAGDVGQVQGIVAQVSDGEASASKTFSVTVQADTDGDGFADSLDNCPLIANADQVDLNANGIGLACEIAPSAVGFSLIANPGVALDFELQGTDGGAGTDVLQYVVVNNPTKGALTQSEPGAARSYLAAADSAGVDSFTYKVSDGEHDSTEATVNIAINTKPSISATPVTAATVDVAYSFAVTASDADGDDLSFSIEGNPSWMSISTTGVVFGTPLTGSEDVVSTVQIKVQDGRGGEAELEAFDVTVAGATPLLHWNSNNWNSTNWQ